MARVGNSSRARKLEGLISKTKSVNAINASTGVFMVEQMHRKGMPISHIASVTRFPYKSIIAIIDNSKRMENDSISTVNCS